MINTVLVKNFIQKDSMAFLKVTGYGWSKKNVLLTLSYARCIGILLQMGTPLKDILF